MDHLHESIFDWSNIRPVFCERSLEARKKSLESTNLNFAVHVLFFHSSQSMVFGSYVGPFQRLLVP